MKLDAQQAVEVLRIIANSLLNDGGEVFEIYGEDDLRAALAALDGKHVVIDAAEYDRLRRAEEVLAEQSRGVREKGGEGA